MLVLISIELADLSDKGSKSLKRRKIFLDASGRSDGCLITVPRQPLLKERMVWW